VIDQERQARERLTPRQLVHVVEDERDGLTPPIEVADACSEQVEAALVASQRLADERAGVGERLDDRPREGTVGVVPSLDRVPGDETVGRVEPAREQRRLAGAGRSRHDRDLRAVPSGERGLQTRPADQRLRQTGREGSRSLPRRRHRIHLQDTLRAPALAQLDRSSPSRC
jgi:hypothetical protein